ncbi:hypothetical protein FJ250_05130 [bacterium]|nr:hypothetical protein [bacterium]
MVKPAATTGRSGFGLLGLIVLLAVVAILAGTVGPLLFREYVAAREAETRARLLRLDEALVAFYRDVGRLPDEAEGLAALVTDPGLGGWGGPYLEGGRGAAAAEVGLDAWNHALAYDRAPQLDTGQAAALVASGGGDGRLGIGTVGGIWTTGGTAPGTPGQDDLLVLVDLGGAASGLEAVTNERLAAISTAAQEHFRLQGSFPAALVDLLDGWLPPSFGAEALADGWGVPLSFSVDAAAHPPFAVVGSRGADGQPGTPDDLQLTIGSAAPGRRATAYELSMAQSRLDAQASLVLEGVWDLDRANLGLGDILATDGWGEPYGIRVSTRTVVSGGPDGDLATPADNLPPGVVPDGP